MIYVAILMIIYMFLLRIYKNELNLCFDQITSFKFVDTNMGIIGSPISDYLNIAQPPTNSLIFIASTTCSYCHSALEELLETIFDNDISLYVWVVSDSDSRYKDFVDLFSNPHTDFLRINEEFLQQLNIKSVPYMLYLNEKCVISEMDFPSLFFVKKINTKYISSKTNHFHTA